MKFGKSGSVKLSNLRF